MENNIKEIRCPNCDKKLADVAWGKCMLLLKCPKCKKIWKFRINTNNPQKESTKECQ